MNNQQAVEILKDFDNQVTVTASGAYQSTIGKMPCELAVAALKKTNRKENYL